MTGPYTSGTSELTGAETGASEDGVQSNGVTPSRRDDQDDQADAQPADASGQDGGWWLTEPDPARVKQAVLELWKRQQSAARKREAKERRNELLRAGVRGVRVVEDEERDSYTVRAPFGSESAPKAPNKADQLIRRIAATLTVDPPSPEVSPNADSDVERAAAELAERLLRVEGSPAMRDDAAMLREAIDLAGTYGSVFRYTYLHPQHALEPVEIQAHPQAQSVDDALTVQQPQTGLALPADPATLITRYVRLDGTLTDTAAEAQLGWVPKVCETLLRPAQVRFVPPVNVTGIADAPGVLVGEVLSLGDVIGRFYEGERPSEEVCKQLVAWKADSVDSSAWVPKAHRELLTADVPRRPDGTLAEDALCAVLLLYFTSGPLAPLGAYVVIGGPKEPILRQPWRAPIGEGKHARMEYLPLPVAQLRWREDCAHGDPFGIAGVDDLGPLEEMRAAALKFVLDYAYRFGSPQVYLPLGTTVQPGQLSRRDGTPIYIDPAATPFYEQLPPLTPVVQELYAAMGQEMDTASGLEAAAQGVASSSVKSGVHARQIIEQALVALAGLQQNSNKFMCRVWVLRLTWMRAFYSVPRVLQSLGEGGDYQQRSWTGTDLMGAGDIQIARGSGTMMPASAKAMMAREDLELATKMGDQSAMTRYYKALVGKTTPLLGLQDDPLRQRIQRQLAAWRDGALQQHPPAPPPQMGMDPQTGQPIEQPAPDPVAQQAAQGFQPNPTDELPYVAPLRLAELADAMAGKAFLEADPRYQQVLYQEYERMRQAAGVMTRAEQQQQQGQQQQQQQQMALELVQTKNADQAAKTAYAESAGGPAAQRMAISNAVETGMRSAPDPNQLGGME